MLGAAMYTTIKTLYELGKSKSEISRLTGHDYKTVSKVVKAIDTGQLEPKRKERTGLLSPYKSRIAEFLEKDLSGVRIHEQLQGDSKDCDDQLREWLDRANGRVHGTTKQVPREVFEKEEKAKLKPLPMGRYKLSKLGRRQVYHDCHIFVDYNYYSVPFDYVGKELDIELDDKFLRVYFNGKQVALHTRLKGRGQFSTEPSHYPKYKQYSETEYQQKY